MRQGRDYRCFGVWDIETSVEYDAEGHPVDTWLSYGVVGVYLSRDGRPTFRRMFTTWEQFRECLTQIVKLVGGRDFVLYAHNFAFEGDFLFKHVGHPEKIIANGPHRPISTRLKEFPSIDFRCSWKLIDKSVAAIGDAVGLPKLDGDYSPLPRGTVPDRKRVEYCTRDCDIVARGIAPYINEYGNIWKVPFTKTGIVRNMLKEYCRQMDPGRQWDLTPDPELYQIMREAFYGGISIANPYFVGLTVHGVGSFDMSSAYPFAALSEQFPRHMEAGDPSQWNGGAGYWIARLRFVNIKSRYNWAWLPGSRVDADEHALKFNGKVVEAKEVNATVCNIDYENICMTYTFDRVEVLEYYPLSDVQRLPDPVYYLFENLATEKQRLKKVVKIDPSEENKVAYAKAKERFNSLYGMMCQQLSEDIYTVNDIGEWSITEVPLDGSTKKHLCRSYLFGVYITAYTRRNLLRFYVTNAGERLVFGDTDSCKMILPPDGVIVDTNAEGEKKIEKEKVGNLGEWERETFRTHWDPENTETTDTIDEFRTYGAKKYWYRTGEVTHITVAGLPYKGVDKKPIDTSDAAFRLGHVWEKVKLARSFLYFGKAVTVDETLGVLNTVETPPDAGGVALYPVSYTLDMTKSDKLYIKIKYGRVVI